MNLATFDIFDTVLVRCVDTPRDVFDLVARRLGWAGFAIARVEAERRARGDVSHGEPTLDEISQRLRGLPSGVTAAAAAAVELEVEQGVWRPVEAAREHVGRARADGAAIGFLSDMYLPSSVLSAWLVRQGIADPSDPVWVSCELRCSKHTGAAYAEVRRRLGFVGTWVHWGDNPKADVERARKAGVDGRLWRAAAWCDGERRWSRLAAGVGGCVRAARLCGAPAAVRGAVAGPAVVLAAFVQAAVDEARSAGLTRLHFLARDGQVLARVAAELGAHRSGVEVRYVHASRRAWRLAAFGADGQDLDQLASLALDARELPEFLLPLGEAIAPPAAWGDVPAWIGDHRARIEAWAREQAAFARAYLEREGLVEDQPVGLVDLGWSGTLQACLVRLRRAWGCTAPVCGWYLGCLRGGDPGLRSFLYPAGQAERRFVHAASAWEMLCPADHGTLLGYGRDGEPRLAPADALTIARARAIQDVIANVATNVVVSGCALPAAAACRRWARMWLASPQPGDLEALRPGYTTRALAAAQQGPGIPRPRRLARLLLTRHRHLEEWPWPGATLAAALPRCPASLRLALLAAREVAWDRFAGPRVEISRLNRPGTPAEKPV